MTAYPITLKEEDDGTWLVDFPDFPECHTFGDDRDGALKYAIDALDTALFGRMIDKENIPAPSPARGRPLVRPTLQMALKALVYQAMRDGGVRKVDLRRRLDWSPAQVERLLSPRHASRLAQFDAAAEALGIVIDVTTSQAPRRQARSPARAAAE